MTAETAVPIAASELETWARALLEASGLAPSPSQIVAHSLVDASLRGVDSHGILRLPVYSRRLTAGLINPDPHPRVVREDGAMALVDGDEGPGSVAGVFATDLALRLAGEHGIAGVGVRRSSHYGAAGYYVRRAARAGCVALSTTNAEPVVVPFGGADWGLGTNPIAFGAPRKGGTFELDMATSQVALGKILLAREKGTPIEPTWAVDAAGAPTTDPNAAQSAVPLGGYKGYGLALLVEVLSGVLTGSGITGGIGRMYDEWDRRQDVGHFVLVLDPERTVGREPFAAVMEDLLTELKAIRPAAGFDEVLVPGEPEDRRAEERATQGIPLPPKVRATLEELSATLGVQAPTRPD
jgi:LDH2 family malate/lactate/ureidoglycolate dehydrogenase